MKSIGALVKTVQELAKQQKKYFICNGLCSRVQITLTAREAIAGAVQMRFLRSFALSLECMVCNTFDCFSAAHSHGKGKLV